MRGAAAPQELRCRELPVIVVFAVYRCKRGRTVGHELRSAGHAERYISNVCEVYCYGRTDAGIRGLDYYFAYSSAPDIVARNAVRACSGVLRAK